MNHSSAPMRTQRFAHKSIRKENWLPTTLLLTKTAAIVYLLCAVLLLAQLSSIGTIITHTNHEHDHAGANDSCTICLELAVAAKTLTQNVSTGTCALTIICAGIAFICQIVCGLKLGSKTLFLLKVRLNI